MYIYILTHFIVILRGKKKKGEAEERWGRWPKVSRMATVPSSVPHTSTGGQRLLQALQDKVDHRQDFSSPLQELGNVLDGHHAQVDQDIRNLHDLP
jgi:hypothetical protein